jgi:hypothetical protein
VITCSSNNPPAAMLIALLLHRAKPTWLNQLSKVLLSQQVTLGCSFWYINVGGHIQSYNELMTWNLWAEAGRVPSRWTSVLLHESLCAEPQKPSIQQTPCNGLRSMTRIGACPPASLGYFS